MRRIISSRSDQWGTTTGFIFAALGSAIGLGNIWRFSYVMGENGGAAFMLVYLAVVAFLGLPLLTAELAIGRTAGGGPLAAFARLRNDRPWRWTGWLGVVASGCILAYYPVIAGWVAHYLWSYTAGAGPGSAEVGFSASFEAFIASLGPPVFWYGLVLVISGSVVAAGVKRGIERVSLVLMPLFALVIVALAGHALALPGAARALEFLFAPTWTALSRPATYLAAIGQAFFSVGLAMGVFVAFGGYLPARMSLLQAGIAIVVGDTTIAVIAGIVIFSAAFTFGFDPAHGPTLAFVVLPEVFASMSGGRWMALGFFSALLLAALTSVIALLEVFVSLATTWPGWSRPRAALMVTGLAFLLALPSALGYGALGHLLPTPPLELIDQVSSDIVLPLSGIAVALFAGWAWPASAAMRASGLSSPWASGLWLWLLRIAVPLTIGLVLVGGLG